MNPELDDIFVLGESVLLARSGVTEGKALGTASQRDLHIARDLLTNRAYHYAKFAENRHIGRVVGKRTLGRVQDRVRGELLALLDDFAQGRVDETELRDEIVRLMKTAWRDVFVAGLRASAHDRQTITTLNADDQRWLRGAMSHEMRFLNRFVSAVIESSWKMPLERRVEMYVRTLESFYDSARVIGMPGLAVLHWVGPEDRRTCAGCRYLFDHSPYTKLTLPTTPRAGATPCLSNCRDRLVVRVGTADEVRALEHDAAVLRERHVNALRRIKRTKR